jgi:hypothetical protein
MSFGPSYTDELVVGDRDGRMPFSSPCLLLATYERRLLTRERVKSTGHGVFLILRELDPGAEGQATYERIGAGQFDASDGKANPFEGIENETVELV